MPITAPSVPLERRRLCTLTVTAGVERRHRASKARAALAAQPSGDEQDQTVWTKYTYTSAFTGIVLYDFGENVTFGYDGNSAKIVSITPFFDTPAPGVPIKLIGTYPSPSLQWDACERKFFAAHGTGIIPHEAP